jgi:hypothetical protein
MIDAVVIANVERLHEQYRSAKPFRHLCIENFLDADAAKKALADFPTFDPRKAMNEFGEVGGKAVVTDIASISPFYATLHAEVCGRSFLQQMGLLTGIDDLEADPQLFGGGTHDNRDGQSLDPHIDFNYDPGTGRHRRLNLLIYLNKEWGEDWGGAIELHSNPRDRAGNWIVSFTPTFNRAVLFETNEHSWHGFPRIRLPTDRRHLSRKCLSFYFYTQTRPTEELAPPRTTHYVPRPLAADLKTPGHVLSEADVSEISRVEAERDRWMAFYQRLEVQMASDYQRMQAHLAAEIERLKAMPDRG